MSRFWRSVLLLGAVMFAAYAIVAIVMRSADGSQRTVAIIGGVMAYAFLAGVAVLFVVDRRRRGRADVTAIAFLRRQPEVERAVGRPVALALAPGQELPPRSGAGAGQANVRVLLRGPRGEAEADVVMARLRAGWEVLRADLIVDGDRVHLGRQPAR